MREFKRVPFDPGWVSHEKLDLKAIYRRPRYVRGEYDEIMRASDADTGLPAWDLTTPLPIRRHNDHIKKGFEYITLADRDSLGQASKSLRARNLNPAEYDQHPELGPWNPKLYMASAAQSDQSAYDELELLVRELGSEVVLAVRRTAEPAFELPEPLRGIAPRGQDNAKRAGAPAPPAPPPERSAAASAKPKAKPRASLAKKPAPAPVAAPVGADA